MRRPESARTPGHGSNGEAVGAPALPHSRGDGVGTGYVNAQYIISILLVAVAGVCIALSFDSLPASLTSSLAMIGGRRGRSKTQHRSHHRLQSPASSKSGDSDPPLEYQPYSCDTLKKHGRTQLPLSRLAAALQRSASPTSPTEHEREGSASPAVGDLDHWTMPVDAACPRYVVAAQDQSATITRRLLSWSMAASIASAFHLTLVHGSLDGGIAADTGPTAGWDAALGLGDGLVQESSVLQEQPSIVTVDISTPGGITYNEDLFEKSLPGTWKIQILGDAERCNVMYRIPAGGWVYDAAWYSKGLMSYQYGVKQKAAGSAAAAPKLVFAASEVNIAVHVRKRSMTDGEKLRDDAALFHDTPELRDGEWYPTHESVMAVALRHVLAEMRDIGIRSKIAVYVFSEEPDPAAFPALKSIADQHPGVRVQFQLGMQEWDTLIHLTESEVFIGSESLLSYWAGVLATKPIVIQQESATKFAYCHYEAACLTREGRLTFAGLLRVRDGLRRLLAMEMCGLIS